MFDYLFILTTLVTAVLFGFQVRYAREIKKAEDSPQLNEFIFKGNPWQLAWAILFPIIYIFLHWERWTLFFLVPLVLLVATIAISIRYRKMTVSLEPGKITINNKSIKVKTEDITGIRISKHEVSLHTKKYINHHRLMTEDLVDKEWPEFQEAIAQYASQFDHINIERV